MLRYSQTPVEFADGTIGRKCLRKVLGVAVFRFVAPDHARERVVEDSHPQWHGCATWYSPGRRGQSTWSA